MATMDDIARTLGVSTSTVSKALSGAEDVSDTMRKAVRETAVALGYTRPRRGEEPPRLAVFVTNMDYQKPEDFAYDIIMGFRKMAEPAGFQVEIIPISHDLENSIHYDEFMLQGNYRGGLFLGLSLSCSWLKDFETCKTPTVLYDNMVIGNPNVTYVGVGNCEGMRLGVNYLKRLGHQKIGYLSSALGSFVYQQRYHAFFEALKESGLPHDETLTGVSYFISECMAEHLPRLIGQGCTAIVCSHDLLAHSAIMQCRDMGLHVPEDISILGFDDLPLCRFTSPPLTTIRQDRAGIGRSAFCALTSQMEGVPLSTFLLHAELICRSSCAPPAQNAPQQSMG